ncbi:NEAT domain-containing protein [Levilactobacillus huananensis]|uniref:NEAT domain-containing protein n=1 Tax=Levilactobacillus huananensis TaxID=2486019 RepID=UPI000F78AFD9|nr:NEAT domain-containing protein [Levilactobacillus huananensis]
MNNVKRWFLIGMLIVASLGCPVIGHAQSLDYTALKYGTSQTSMAGKYFVHPAKVKVAQNAYQVTMEIKTAKHLNKWPVRVLKIAGQTPQNVQKSRDSAGNYLLFYTFTTAHLNRDVTAKLAINVLGVYKATHKLTLAFQTVNMPALSQAKASTRRQTPTTPTTAAKQTQSSTIKASSQKPTSKKQAASASATTASPASSSNSRSAMSSSVASQEADTADQVPKQRTNWMSLLGGSLAIVIVVIGGSWWYFGRH